MYRNGRNRRGMEKGNDSFRTMLILSGSVLAIAIITFIITYSIYNSRLNHGSEQVIDSEMIASLVNNNITESTSSVIGKSVTEVKNEMNIINNSANRTDTLSTTTNTSEETNIKSINNTTPVITITDTTSEEKKVINTEENITTIEEPKKDPIFVKPVEGEIIREYAKDNLVYSQTLDEWITHLGIDIKAEKTTVVKAAADGVVETIKNDPRYGLTVIVSHDNGFKTVYSNLLTAEFVTEGEKIESGQTIGTVGNNAAFEISDEPHLHFELIKDNEKLDPTIYIRF